MKVVILAGGQGTRLREETEYRPKPMVEVGNRPILWHIMKLFGHHGLNQFIVCLGYKGEMVKDYFLRYEAINNDFTIRLGARQQITYHNGHDEQNFTVTLADTGVESLTADRVRRVAPYIDSDCFMLTYGDGVADIDLSALLAFHRSHGRIATTTAVRPISRFGTVNLESDGRVASFAEKPRSDAWISAGFFVFNREIFDRLPSHSCMLEREPLEQLSRDGQLMAYRHEGFFFAMDTYREYKALNDMWTSGEAPWKVWQ